MKSESTSRVKVVYVAGPYRARTVWKVAKNIFQAKMMGLRVAKLGAMPFVPHANTAFYDGELPDRFWLEGTLEVLSRCDALLLMPKWRKSSGTKAEVKLARNLGIPVFESVADLKTWLIENRPNLSLDES